MFGYKNLISIIHSKFHNLKSVTDELNKCSLVRNEVGVALPVKQLQPKLVWSDFKASNFHTLVPYVHKAGNYELGVAQA